MRLRGLPEFVKKCVHFEYSTRGWEGSTGEKFKFEMGGAKTARARYALKKQKNPPQVWGIFPEWASQDLNPGPSGYEPPALTN